MTRLVFGQFLAHPTHDVCHPLLLYGTAYPEPVERQCGDVRSGLTAQVLVLRALNDTEESLIRPLRSIGGDSSMLRDAPLSPFESSAHRNLLIVARVHQRGALVEREDDVGP